MTPSAGAPVLQEADLYDEDLYDEDDGEYASSSDEDEPDAGGQRSKKRKADAEGQPGAAKKPKLTQRSRKYGNVMLEAYPGRAPPDAAVKRLAAALKLEAGPLAAFVDWFAKKELQRVKKLKKSLEPAPPLREAFAKCTSCGKLRCVSARLAKSLDFTCSRNPDEARDSCEAEEEMDAAAAEAWVAALAARRAAAERLLPRNPRAAAAGGSSAQRRPPAPTWRQKALRENGAFTALSAHLEALRLQPRGAAEEDDEDEDEEADAREETAAADGGAPAGSPGGAGAAGSAPKAGGKKRAQPERWTAKQAEAVMEEAQSQGLFAPHTTAASVRAALIARGALPERMKTARVSTLLESFRRTSGCVRATPCAPLRWLTPPALHDAAH